MVSTLKTISFAWFVSLFMGFALLPAYGNTVELPDGSKADLSSTCPVCNMKVEAGNLGFAAVVLENGKVIALDGPGDLFRFVLAPGQYGAENAPIKHVFVTDYGNRTLIDAKKGFFVVGSDLSGGMGPEAVPFSTREAAEKFKSDHKGKELLTYDQVTLDHLKARKKILKMDQGSGPSGSGHGH
jgi:copper chaperone NosL